jgi:uncharacterized protein YeaO (DUF488 family)
MTFSALATATGIPTTTLNRRLKALVGSGIVSFYELAGSYGLTLWLRSEKLGFKTALELVEGSEPSNKPFRIYTIGYEGRTPDSFVNVLLSNGLERLVDVREIANSRKAGYSSGSLRSLLERNDIEYVHMRELGSPQKMRRDYREDNDFVSFSKKYESFLDGKKDDIKTLAGLAVEKPTAIMCFEKEASDCHRSIIAARIAKLGFQVKDL